MTNKYLLLDIDDTIAPLSYKGRDAVYIDRVGIRLGIPKYIADWLHDSPEKDIKVIWCTRRPPGVCSLFEKKISFKSYGRISFINGKAYNWDKLFSIIQFCNHHSDDVVILADNDIRDGTRGVQNLPPNLKLVPPADDSFGCLTEADLKIIESF